MSKKKKQQKQQQPNSDPLDRQSLEMTQAEHLRFCERLGAGLPKVAGVPVVQAMAYELVQSLNHAHIAQVLKQREVAS